MHRLTGARQRYAWGSLTSIPDFLGQPCDDEPFAELWFGAHPSAPSLLADGRPLSEFLAEDPQRRLGQGALSVFGPRLPYLVKLIAPASPLSLQVHPSTAQATVGFLDEEAAGIPLGAPHRRFPDDNHKPEMLYALEPFEAVAGFRTARRALAVLAGLDSALASDILDDLRSDLGPAGIRAAFARLIDPTTRPTSEMVTATVAACEVRLAAGASPSVRADSIVSTLGRAFPGDPGAVATLLMNPVSLRPGEVLFVPAGGVHCYLSGLAIEVMASSDNVLRAGLTTKHVDPSTVLDIVDWVAAPPVRIGSERVSADAEVFYAPVDDFALAVVTAAPGPVAVPGRGPRLVMCIDGTVTASHLGESLSLRRGQAAFVPPSDERVIVRGGGQLAQVTVP